MSGSTRLSLPMLPPSPIAPPLDEVGTALKPVEVSRATIETASTTQTDVAKANAEAVAAGCLAIDRLRATRECNHALSLSLMRAAWWFQSLGQYLNLIRVELHGPHVSANADDEVVFEWWRAERKLTMYFTATSVEFVRSWGANVLDEMNDGEVTSGLDATTLWRWLADGR